MAGDSANRGSAPQEKAGDTTRKLSPEMEILAKWLKEYKDHFWVINMENDRMRRISKVLEETTKAQVFIFLMHPRRPATLVQRGAFDADLTIFDGSEYSSKDPEELEEKLKELAKELAEATDPMSDSTHAAWLRAVALGASCPLEGAYTEMALKMQAPEEEGITIQKAQRQVLVTEKNYRGKSHLPEWPTGFKTRKDTYRWLEDTVYVKKAKVSGSNKDQADGDWEFGVFKPLYMFGQSAAVWIHFSKDEPPELPDFSPVFEGLMLERFPRHCERVDLLDGKEALPEFLKGCAYLWRPTTLCAKDKDGNCLAALGYPEKHIFNTPLGTIDPPKPASLSGNDSTFRIEYLRRAPSASEAFASVKKEGKCDFVRFHALHLPDNHKSVFSDLESIVWEIPDMVLEDVIETVNGEKQIKEAFKRQLERVSRSLSDGLGVLEKQLRMQDVVRAERAKELLPDWAHAYGGYLAVLQALATEGTPKEVRIREEIESAAKANETLVRWGAMEDWRHKNRTLELRSLFRPDRERQEPQWLDIRVCLRHSLVRLLAKMRNGEEGYGNALEKDWKEIKGKIDAVWNACAARVGLAKIVKELENLGIECTVQSWENHGFPGILQIPPDNQPANFGQLISFVVDELLFNGFKNAQLVGSSKLPTLSINYEEIGEDAGKHGCLSVSNTTRESEETFQELQTSGREGRGRGIGLMNGIAYVINGEGERSRVQYSLVKSLLTAKFYIPLLKMF